MRFAAAISQVGSPASRKAIAISAVSQVATHGTSRFERSASTRGSSPSSESCESVRDAPASGCSVPWNMLKTMNQIAAALAPLPSKGPKVGPSEPARLS